VFLIAELPSTCLKGPSAASLVPCEDFLPDFFKIWKFLDQPIFKKLPVNSFGHGSLDNMFPNATERSTFA